MHFDGDSRAYGDPEWYVQRRFCGAGVGLRRCRPGVHLLACNVDARAFTPWQQLVGASNTEFGLQGSPKYILGLALISNGFSAFARKLNHLEEYDYYNLNIDISIIFGAGCIWGFPVAMYMHALALTKKLLNLLSQYMIKLLGSIS